MKLNPISRHIEKIIYWGDARAAFVIANRCQIANLSVHHIVNKTPLPEMLQLNIHSALVDHIRFG